MLTNFYYRLIDYVHYFQLIIIDKKMIISKTLQKAYR